MTTEQIQEARSFIQRSKEDAVAYRLAELLDWERKSKATLKVMNILSTNDDFAHTANKSKLEWAFGRKITAQEVA